MSAVPTKVSYQQEIRRLSCNGVYSDLLASIAQIYSLPINQLVLQYTDDEGDLVHVSTQPELDEAIKLSLNSTSKLLRVTASLKNEQPSPQIARSVSESHFSAPEQFTTSVVYPENIVEDDDHPDIFDLKRRIENLKAQKRQLMQNRRSPDCNRQMWKAQRDNLKSEIRQLKAEKKHGCWRKNKFNGQNYRARFISSSPKYANFTPGEKFTQAFKIRNEGNDSWPPGTMLVPVGKATDHNYLGTSDKYFQVPSVAPGNTTEIQIPLQAPSQCGRYYGAWRLCTNTMQKFGPRFDVVIHVEPHSDDESPKVPKEAPVINWLELLQQLESMGYTDKKRNLALLRQSNGNLSLVVDHLLHQ